MDTARLVSHLNLPSFTLCKILGEICEGLPVWTIFYKMLVIDKLAVEAPRRLLAQQLRQEEGPGVLSKR